MASVNKVIIVGNLGRDPDIRYLPSGDPIANIAVATSFKSKNAAGEVKEVTEWHRIAFFGRLAEIVGQFLKKGSSVYVEGRLQTRKYVGDDGIERYATDIVAEQMQMLGSPAGAHRDAIAQDSHQEPELQQAPAAPRAAVAATEKAPGKAASKRARQVQPVETQETAWDEPASAK